MQVISISCNHWCSTHKPPRCSTRSLCGASIVKNRNFIQTVSISRIFLIFFQFSEFKQSHVILQSFGISIVFVATRSGLLRWRDVVPVEEQLLDDFGYVSFFNYFPLSKFLTRGCSPSQFFVGLSMKLTPNPTTKFGTREPSISTRKIQTVSSIQFLLTQVNS